jgi:hypothetical protein
MITVSVFLYTGDKGKTKYCVNIITYADRKELFIETENETEIGKMCS